MKRMVVLLLGALLFLASCKNEPGATNTNTDVSERLSPTATVTAYSDAPEPTPTSIPNPESSPEEGGITKVTTDSGYRLVSGENEQAGELFATAMDGGSTYTVHVLATEEPGDAEGLYGRKAVVVHPESGEFRTYPLFQAKIAGDSYAVHSIAKAYGFVDDLNLLYIAVHNDDAEPDVHYYSAEKLDIVTGEKTVLIPRIQSFDGLPPSEHFAQGWLTEGKDKLILNSYSEGKLWSIDTASGDMKLLPAKANHHWPFFMTSVSPDGELIWHFDSENSRYVLLDAEGGIRQSFPFPSESAREQYGWFFWSPNGEYAVNYSSSASNDNAIIQEDSDVVTRAMDRITMYDREGNGRSIAFDRSSSPYVEVAGWLGDNDEYAVLRFYDLEGTEGVRTVVDEAYMLYDVENGSGVELKTGAAEQKLTDPEPVILYQSRPGVEQSVLLVDRKAGAIIKLNESGVWIKNDDSVKGATAWIRLDGTDGNAGLLWTMDGSYSDIREQPIRSNSGINEAIVAGESWIVLPDLTYIRLE